MMTNTCQPVTALILAGVRPGAVDPVAQQENVAHKALATVNDRPILSYVIEALRRSPSIGQIVISSPSASLFEHWQSDGVTFVTSSREGPSLSVYQALARFGTPLLVTTSDNALLQTSWLDTFLKESVKSKADLTIAVTPKEIVQSQLPQTKRTFIELRDLHFSGCNLFLLKRSVCARVVELWREVEKLRKHPLRIALKLGILTVLRALTNQLDQRAFYQRIYDLTSTHIDLIPLRDGRAAVDVDKPSDLKLVRTLMRTAPHSPSFS